MRHNKEFENAYFALGNRCHIVTLIGRRRLRGSRIEAGEWEFQMKMEMPGMPANMPAMSYKSCMQQDNPVPPQAQKDKGSANCALKHKKMTGDAAKWTVRCTDKDMVSETTGKGIYRGNTMEAKQTTTMTQAGGAPQTMTHTVTGRRVGPARNSGSARVGGRGV